MQTRPSALPRTPIAPGRFLHSRFLQPARLSQTEAARLLGISRRRLNEIIQGHRAITPDTAIKLGQLFGLHARFWLALQGDWDLAQLARPARGAKLDYRKPEKVE